MLVKRIRAQRYGALLLIGAAFAGIAVGVPAVAQAQRGGLFDNWFRPFPSNRPPAETRSAPADFSRAPAPAARRPDAPAPTSNILVVGDAMADWLAYGLEDALAETQEFGVLRRHRTTSGLIRYDARNEAQDWAQVARELITADKPHFVVIMVGLNDRQAIRERVAAPPPARGGRPAAPAQTPAPPAAEPAAPPGQEAERPADQTDSDQPTIAVPETAPRPRVAGTHEFRSEKWVELYSKRIDDTIAALKGRGIPVFWVGLPSIRGQRSTADALYLNELYRSRAEKAGIVFIDVWDGFVDEAGRFALQGPDLEGQIRRLRASDGVYFTRSGARKLAHYVEREIRRVALRGPATVALPTSEPQSQTPSGRPDGPAARPLAGPVMPLTAAANSGADGLLGGANATPATDHVTVTRVLVKGETVQAPAGRGDDFAWPRRGVAPFGTDPAVATSSLPIPVMVAAPPKTVLSPSSDAAPASVAPRRAAAAPAAAPQRQQPPASRPFFFPFFR